MLKLFLSFSGRVNLGRLLGSDRFLVVGAAGCSVPALQFCDVARAVS